jgi:hypothetical protein
MSIKLVSTGGGSVTIQEPNTASDFTLSVPAQTGSVVTADSSGRILVTGSGYTTNPTGLVIGQYTSTIAYLQAPAGGQIDIWDDASNSIAQFKDNGDFRFNSGYGSAGVAYGCRAWVNFDGTGTVAIRGSGNVSSITDVGTGTYWVNFTNSMPDTNYCVTSTRQWRGICNPDAWETGRVYVISNDTANTSPVDTAQIYVAIHR